MAKAKGNGDLKSKLSLDTTNKKKDELTKGQKNKVKKLYEQAMKNLEKEFKNVEQMSDSATKSLKQKQLNSLQKAMEKEYNKVTEQLEKEIKDQMEEVSKKVFEPTFDFAKAIGLQTSTDFADVPTKIVSDILNGKVYSGDWSLSKAIWGDNKKVLKDIDQIIAIGVAENKSAYDIAKDLEKYVDPSAKKPWDWGKVYPGSNKTIDYNAQRLARTLVNHAYQQSVIINAKNNPFVKGVKWISSHDDRVCELCKKRDGQIYDPDDVPLDHPNGRCTLVNVTESSTEIADRLADWVKGKTDKSLDNYAKFLTNGKFQKQALKVMQENAKKATKKDNDGVKFDEQEWLNILQRQYNNPETYTSLFNNYNLTDDEYFALRKYTGSLYEDINSQLRGIDDWGDGPNKIIQEYIDNMHKAFEKETNKLKEPLVLRRGSDIKSLKAMFGNINMDDTELAEKVKDAIGSTLFDKAFLSCTPDATAGFTAKGVEYRIMCPVGTEAMYLDPISVNKGEEEILLNSGYEYMIKKIEYRPQGGMKFEGITKKDYGDETYIVWLEVILGSNKK